MVFDAPDFHRVIAELGQPLDERFERNRMIRVRTQCECPTAEGDLVHELFLDDRATV